MDMPPNQELYCKLVAYFMAVSGQISTFVLVAMTFERFYSIVRPHKAASFNTVKRAKITIMSIVMFTVLFNIPNMTSMLTSGRKCLGQAKIIHTLYGQMFYCLCVILNFAFPFVSLLAMNTVIIHTLRTRFTKILGRSEGHGQSEGEGQTIKNSESQIYITLVLVTFSFLLLVTPTYVILPFTSRSDSRGIPFHLRLVLFALQNHAKITVHKLRIKLLSLCSIRSKVQIRFSSVV